MKLSIITVNLNNREGLQKTIDSVVSQTFKDFEWIVIDGGSTDGSKELIEQYADHFAYWVSEPDKGIYNAMNKGIKVAKGEYLQFLNSGDWLWEKKTLEKVFRENREEDVLYGNFVFRGQLYVTPYKLNTSHVYGSALNHQATFIRRSLFGTECYDEDYVIVSDWKFFLQKLVLGKSSNSKVDASIVGIEEGHSYDTTIIDKERDQVMDVLFSPMLRATIEEDSAAQESTMKNYYYYIEQNKSLQKKVRRIVNIHRPSPIKYFAKSIYSHFLSFVNHSLWNRH